MYGVNNYCLTVMSRVMFSVCLVLMMIISRPVNAETTGDTPAYQLVATKDNRLISDNRLSAELATYDIVAFGELHDNNIAHEVELSVLKGLYQIHGQNLVLSLEMFERDVQPLLNSYLLGEISEEHFLANSRPWKNYHEAYRPLVEFAKTHSIPVIAANIPRYLANKVAKGEKLRDFAPADKQYLPRIHKAPKGRYRDKFFAVMESHMIALGKDKSKATLKLFYKAQCLKDDTMAESIADYQNSHAGAVVLHVHGAFHGAEHLGTVERLHSLLPDSRIAVLDTVEVDLASLPEVIGSYQANGEYLLLVNKS